jgi:superfamily II DNA helicase RecQ
VGLKYQNSDWRLLVYTATHRNAEELFEKLKSEVSVSILGLYKSNFGVEATALNDTLQEQFVDGKIRIMVATTAFGCGIDVDCVRSVYFYGLPWSLLDLAQQAGRAGRDGNDAEAIVFFCKQTDDGFVSNLFHPADEPGLQDVQEMVSSPRCRRLVLQEHVDSSAISCILDVGSRHCDVCELAYKKYSGKSSNGMTFQHKTFEILFCFTLLHHS